MYIIILNLTTDLAFSLHIAGTQNVHGLNPTASSTDYQKQFNATQVAKGWRSNPLMSIPLIGDIYSAFQFLTQNLPYLVGGFHLLLVWISDTYITDFGAKVAFGYIIDRFDAIYGILIFIFFIEFIGGRYMTD
jgi:hypothetical protein